MIVLLEPKPDGYILLVNGPEIDPYDVVVVLGSGLNTSTVVTPPDTTGSVVVVKSSPVQALVAVVCPGRNTSTVSVAPLEAGEIVVVEATLPVQYEVVVVVLYGSSTMTQIVPFGPEGYMVVASATDMPP